MQIWLLLMLVALTACQQENTLIQHDVINGSPIVASVNGVNIYESDIDTEMANLPVSMVQYRNDPKSRLHILQTLIRRQTISQQAKVLGLDKHPLVQQRMQAARQKILIEAAKSWQLAHMPAIQATAIQAYYDAHLDAFKVPAQAHARHILLDNEKSAWKVLKKLRRNRASFAALAASQSLDVSNKSRGGNLNWFSRGMMVKAFDDVVFSLKPHGLSKPVKTKFGWHVIELLGKRPARQQRLKEVRDEIISILQHQRLQHWYQQVEAKTNIMIVKPEYQ